VKSAPLPEPEPLPELTDEQREAFRLQAQMLLADPLLFPATRPAPSWSTSRAIQASRFRATK